MTFISFYSSINRYKEFVPIRQVIYTQWFLSYHGQETTLMPSSSISIIFPSVRGPPAWWQMESIDERTPWCLKIVMNLPSRFTWILSPSRGKDEFEITHHFPDILHIVTTTRSPRTAHSISGETIIEDLTGHQSWFIPSRSLFLSTSLRYLINSL